MVGRALCRACFAPVAPPEVPITGRGTTVDASATAVISCVYSMRDLLRRQTVFRSDACHGTYGYGKNDRRACRITYSDDRLRVRQEQARRPGLGAYLREFRAAGRLARGEAPRRAGHDL